LTGYIYDTSVYFGSDRQKATRMMATMHGTMKSLKRRVEGAGHKLYMDNFFSYTDLFDYLLTRAINCFGNDRQNHKGMSGDCDDKL
jgi:hypothetical protein